MTGIEAIAKERSRQIKEEGYSATRDDRYTKNQLALVAASYLLTIKRKSLRYPPNFWPAGWPWTSWKPEPGNRKRELEKAGALIAADWDRIDREEKELR